MRLGSYGRRILRTCEKGLFDSLPRGTMVVCPPALAPPLTRRVAGFETRRRLHPWTSSPPSLPSRPFCSSDSCCVEPPKVCNTPLGMAPALSGCPQGLGSKTPTRNTACHTLVIACYACHSLSNACHRPTATISKQHHTLAAVINGPATHNLPHRCSKARHSSARPHTRQ